ncbi:unnamed protein product [Urochloa decumbens]|uniref:BHLH domain-containing protein n=1 Tax=Urochloa decumbens TaxID=240449 RepID=A0ABC9EW85_9POAL
MWGGGVEHGMSQEAAPPHQLLPWLGAAAPFAEPAAVAGFSAAMGAYAACDGGLGIGYGHGGMLGFAGFDAAAAQQQQGAAAEGSGKAVVVSGLLGSLQAELGRMATAREVEAKSLAASRNHSEAERRRRQRINGHLARLRSLLPNTTKTDKASLLAEVLDHVKELKRQTSAMMVAAVAGGGDDDEGAAGPAQMLPTEADELAVDAAADRAGRLVVRASLCCEDRPDLIPDIVRALAALRMRARRAEITTLGGRVRSVLLITADEQGAEDDPLGGDEDEDDGRRLNALRRGERVASTLSHRRHECIASVQEALRGVMDRRAASSDTSSSGGGSIKRQRMNYGAQEQCSV